MKRLVVLVLLLTVACGSGPKAAPRSVTDALSVVDRLVTAHDYNGARGALDDLVRRTEAARAAGSIDRDRAERITAAAAQLAAALPVPVPAPPRAPVPPPAPAPPHGHGHGHGDEGKGKPGGGGD